MSKWVAGEQNLPLGPCGSLQLLSPASFHLVQPRLLSPFILSVALLLQHICRGVFLSEETVFSAFLIEELSLYFF